MKYLVIQIVTLIILVPLITIGQEVEKQNTIKEKADIAAKNTDPFSTDYFNQKNNQHFVVEIIIIDGRISDEQPKLELKPGKFQKVYTSGEVKVSWLNNQGEEIGNYLIEDPTTVRTWDKPEIKKLEKGTFHLNLPLDTRISFLSISKSGKEMNRWKIEEYIKRLIDM